MISFFAETERYYIRFQISAMRYFQLTLRFIFTLYAFLLFIAVMLITFPFIVIASFFGKVKGGNIIYTICRIWVASLLPLWGIFHKNIYEVPHDLNRQYVFVFNHISYMDIPILFRALGGQHIRVLGKAEMSKVPVFGFLYRNAAVMVDRASAVKRAKSVARLKAFIRKGISIVIAPEGTFNMSDKPQKNFYDGAFRIAIETQTPIKPILFLNTHDRLNNKSIFSLNPGRSRAVFLEEVPVDGLTINDVTDLREKVYKLMEEKLIFYKASWINNY